MSGILSWRRAIRTGVGLGFAVAIAIFVAPADLAGQVLSQPQTAIPQAVPVAASNGMVVTQEARAAHIGVDILQQGGNAVDAAVAVGFALAVSYPRAGNIGGGGFMVIHLASGRGYRHRLSRDRAGGDQCQELSRRLRATPIRRSRATSALAIGVPGTVAGLALAEKEYGSGHFTLADLIAPAIAMARDGITLDDDITNEQTNILARLAHWPASAKIFLKADGSGLSAGDRLVQSDLANTLESIARDGPDAFYQGPIAWKIAAAVQAAGGVMTVDDLKDYRAIERAPVRGSYRGYDIVSMPPPSSGGVELLEMLNILEGYDLAHDDQTQTSFLMIEAMKRAYADRALFLGDPETVQGSGGETHLQELCRHAARRHRSRTRNAGERRSAPAAAAIPKVITRRIFRSSTVSAMRYPTPTRSISATASAWSPTAPAFCSTTSSTIFPPNRTHQTPTA